MKREKPALLAWIYCGVIILLLIIEAGMTYNAPGASKTIPGILNGLTSTLVYIVAAIVGAIIVSHQPRNTIGWLLIFIASAVALLTPTELFLPQPGDNLGQVSTVALLAVWVNSWGWWLLIGPILLIPLLFPTGKLLSPRWRWVVAAVMADFLFFLFLTTFAIKLQIGAILIENPLGFLSEDSINRIVSYFLPMLITTAAFCVAAIFVRYRRAADVERQQIKWLLFAYAIFLVFYLIGAFLKGESDWNGIVFNITILAIPLAIGASILRYRLWDIDLIIRRTLVYAVLSGLLGLVYFGSVVLLRQFLGGLVGDSSIAIVLSTLLIALLFSPLRRALQEGIDRRFYRQKYNAEQALSTFRLASRDEVELEKIQKQLVKTISQTIQPAYVSIWLREARKPHER